MKCKLISSQASQVVLLTKLSNWFMFVGVLYQSQGGSHLVVYLIVYARQKLYILVCRTCYHISDREALLHCKDCKETITYRVCLNTWKRKFELAATYCYTCVSYTKISSLFCCSILVIFWYFSVVSTRLWKQPVLPVISFPWGLDMMYV